MFLCFRGLYFIVKFFQYILSDTNGEIEDLGPSLQKAYTETLQMHHGWMGTQLFSVNIRSVQFFILLIVIVLGDK